MVHGALSETINDHGAVKKVQEKKLDVAVMTILRWMNGVTKLGGLRNERRGQRKWEKHPRKCRKGG